MPKLKPIHRYPLIENIKEFFKIQSWMPIIPWAEKNINFTDDVSNERDHLDFSIFPFQIAPIKEWEDLNTIKKVTLVFPQQSRKD